MRARREVVLALAVAVRAQQRNRMPPSFQLDAFSKK